MPPADAPGPAAARIAEFVGGPYAGRSYWGANAPGDFPAILPIPGREEGRYALHRDALGVERYHWQADAAPEPEYVRAPVRTLAPGIEQSDDTCDGKPRLAGTRFRTDAVRGVGDYGAWARARENLVAYPHIDERQFAVAVAFEAGRSWERERRAARKRKRLAKRWREGEEAAKGASDGR